MTMGFMDNIKQQFSKNKHKVAPLVDKATDQVDKATDQVDKVTKGKSSSITSKVDDAARTISGGSTTSGTKPMPTETVADDAEGPGAS